MKPGRNDLCPCGSGKKYKDCCLGKSGFSDEPTAMEMRGTPSLATDALNDMRRIAGDREFASAEEFQAFLDSYMAIKNSQPIADFAGLSPEDIHIMFTDRRKAIERLVTITGPITTEETRGIPVLRAAIALLRELERGQIRVTASGYLAPEAAGRWFDEAFELEESPRVREIMKPKSESGHIPLVRFRTCVCLAGLAEEKSSKLCITEMGRAILAREDWEALYRELFAAMIELYNDTAHPVNDRMMD
ncbi:MAG TPA: SEC-C domain-containing protein, partial [Treponemataceae bacterium]|nr:SEC-C domain-containing protein [Treponemataceae bacterium]